MIIGKMDTAAMYDEFVWWIFRMMDMYDEYVMMNMYDE